MDDNKPPEYKQTIEPDCDTPMLREAQEQISAAYDDRIQPKPCKPNKQDNVC